MEGRNNNAAALIFLELLCAEIHAVSRLMGREKQSDLSRRILRFDVAS
jgi:hypothetical protein